MQERNDSRTLRKVPVRYLWAGMCLPDDLYSADGKVLLIRAGEIITERTIERLANMGSEDNCVMTYDESCRIIYEGETVPPEIRQRMREDRIGYTNLWKKVQSFLGLISRAVELEPEDAETVAEGVMQKIGVMDYCDLFRCIDVPREMDGSLQRHSLNVAFLNGLMGHWMEFSDEETKQLVMAGLLHDIGKTQIPEEILTAPRELTAEECEIMRRHPVYSGDILKGQFDAVVCDAVRHHHEKMDGTGYPDGLAGEDISVFARITAISDIYDAMVSARSYKEARLPFDILEKMSEHTFEGLDRKLTTVFVKNMIRHFKNRQVTMSDGTVGVVAYIPPNDLSHPVISTADTVRQADETWYCREVYDELHEKDAHRHHL